MLKILMVNNICSISYNLKKGLIELGHNVVLVFDEHKYLSGKPDYQLKDIKRFYKQYPDDFFDIVHIHYPCFKWIIPFRKYIKHSKLILHWHGSDLREFPVSFYKDFKNFCFKKLDDIAIRYYKKKAVFHFYSTPDLSWWLRDIPKNKQMWFLNPVDIDMFKSKNNGDNHIVFNNEFKLGIEHDLFPSFLEQFSSAEVVPSYNLNPFQLYVTTLECLSMDIKVKYHEDKNREWVIENCSIPIVVKRLEDVYNKV